jgi:parallel beta-helix repeat protein
MGVWSGFDGTFTSQSATVSNNTLSKNYGYGVIFDSTNGTSQNNYFQDNPVGLLVTDSSANSTVTSINDSFSGNPINSEALHTPGSTFNENLVVETTGSPFYFPPGPHFMHFPYIY